MQYAPSFAYTPPSTAVTMMLSKRQPSDLLVSECIVSNVVVWVGDGLKRFVVMLCLIRDRVMSDDAPASQRLAAAKAAEQRSQ